MRYLIFLVLILSAGCMTTDKEKTGPVTGKAYDCRKSVDAAEYKKECVQDYRNKCVAKLSDLSESNRRLLAEGRIAIGMSKSEVFCAYGEPAQVIRDESQTGTFVQWVYGDVDTEMVHLYFHNDKLIASRD